MSKKQKTETNVETAKESKRDSRSEDVVATMEPTPWRTVQRYDYTCLADGRGRIEISAEGDLKRTFTYRSDEACGMNAVLNMLRFHKDCEFNVEGPPTFRVRGRKPGKG